MEKHLAANFILRPSEVHEKDLLAVPFLIVSLLQPAGIIRGMSDPELARRELRRQLPDILPGAISQGNIFVINPVQYIQQVVLRERLVNISA